MNERLIHLDFLRLIAIMSVIIMHSTGAVQKFYSVDVDNTFLFTNVPNSITRFSVPLFIMISGRLMINRGYDYKYLLKKSAHYMSIFFIWSLIYSIVLIEQPYFKTHSLKSLIVNTVTDSLTGWFHFWFLFLICGLYLVLPLIEIIINNIPTKILHYYISLNIIFCFLGSSLMNFSTINRIFGDHLNNFMVGFLNIYTFYFMLGYWLKDLTINNKRILWYGMIAGLLYNAIIGNISSIIANERVVSFIDARSPITLIICVCLFLLSQHLDVPEGKARKAVVLLSELSFGVYLCHMLIIEMIKKLFPMIGKPLAACMLTITITSVVGFGISWILWQNRITRVMVK